MNLSNSDFQLNFELPEDFPCSYAGIEDVEYEELPADSNVEPSEIHIAEP